MIIWFTVQEVESAVVALSDVERRDISKKTMASETCLKESRELAWAREKLHFDE